MFNRKNKQSKDVEQTQQETRSPVFYHGEKAVYYTGEDPAIELQAKALSITADGSNARVLFQIEDEPNSTLRYCSVGFKEWMHDYEYADGESATHNFPVLRDIDELKDYVFTLAVRETGQQQHYGAYILAYRKI